MPIPKPRKSENKDNFFDRCMGNDTMVDEYPENDQRYAVCQSAWRRRNNMSKFLSISVNFISLGRTEIINGVEHKVYPVTMLVEGVHHGAVGCPTFYPGSVLQQFASQWNNVPIPIQHPQDNEGNYISANSPGVQNIGFIRNTFFEKGKLKAEACINITVAETTMPGIIDQLDAGGMEVSTGLFAEVNETPGQWGNEQFEVSVLSIVPDHLAILPGGTGACSVQDGCGIRPHEGKDMKVLTNDKYQALLENKLKANEVSHDDIRRQLSQYVDSMDVHRTEEGSDYKINFVEAVYPTYFIYREESNNGTRLYKQLYTENQGRVNIDPAKVEVFKKTDYLPVQGNSEGESKMANDAPCCPEKVRALIANEHTTFTDADVEWLENMTENQLGHFEAMAEAAAEKAKKPVPKELEVNKGSSISPVTMESYLDAAPPEIKRVLNAGLRQLDKARGEMIATILANEANTFTEAQLKEMADDTLEGISALSATVKKDEQPIPNPWTYIGRGGGGLTGNTNHEEEAYVPQTLNFDTKK